MKRTNCSRILACIALSISWIAVCACNREGFGTAPPRARLFEGMGAIHHPIATGSKDAQKFFDQGLALVYAFNFGEAINSFRHASELDPDSPMPYWGMALAYAPNYNGPTVSRDHEQAGFDAIQTAVGLLPKASEPERAYVKAMAHSFTDKPKPDQAQMARDYSNAMRGVYQKYPDDPDAAALFAASLMNLNPWHLWAIEGQPGPDTAEIIDVLEKALARWPLHTGVNHFYIHTMEASPNPERALPSAHRLESLAPAASHLVHMPSHIYLRDGDYGAAVKSNQQAIAADRSYQRMQPAAPAGVMGYANHNQHFLAVSASMAGDFETARTAAAELQTHMHNEAMGAMSLLVLMRFARWDDVLAVPEPDPDQRGVTFIWHLARASAYAGKRQLKEAEAEQVAMEEAFSRLPAGRAFGSFFNDWNALHSLADDTLAARVAAARGDTESSVGHWRNAVAIEDKLNFDDVPDWYYPIRESLGAALLRYGRASDAEQVFREDLRRNPRNPRSLFGLSKALEAENKMYEADLTRRAFAMAWQGKEPPRLEDL